MSKPVIYTVGHSTHPLDHFLDLLRAHSVNCVVDVRSVPASRYNPQYNKEVFSRSLSESGIAYLHFPEEFGARHTQPSLLDEEGRVDFEKVRASRAFRHGVERLRAGLGKGFTISLMCAESEPFDCHRFSMVSRGLEEDGFDVRHILRDKTLKSNEELEDRLLKKYEKKIPKPGLFQPAISPEEALRAAYRLRNKEIGFSAKAKQRKESDLDWEEEGL